MVKFCRRRRRCNNDSHYHRGHRTGSRSKNVSFENFSTSADRVKFPFLSGYAPPTLSRGCRRPQTASSFDRRPFDGANAKVDGRHLGVKAASREGIEGERRAADLILIIGEENLADQTELGE